MSSKLTTMGIVLIATLTGSIALAEEAPSLGFDISADYVGKYIWRGQNLQDDGAFQPSVNLAYGKFSANIWASTELSKINGNSGEITEVDYTLDYSDALCEGIGYSIGVINYVFPNTGVEDTTEIYAGLSFDTFLSPSITLYHDVDEAKGSYVSVGIGHTVEKVIGDVPADISASLGWGSGSYNDYYWGVNKSKANDLAISIAFPVELENGWSLTPSLNYVTLVSNDIEKANTYGDGNDSFFYIGVGLSKSF
jgi:hypothetical protein